MPWARLDDDFHDNGKILGLSHPAFRLYVCAITYCRRHRSLGVLTGAQVEALCRQQRVPRPTIAELVGKRAWHEHASGYRIHDFEHYQPKGDETNAERQRRYRERHATAVSNGAVTTLRNDPVPMPIPIVVTTPSQTESQEQKQTPGAIPTHGDSANRRVRARPRYSLDFEDFWLTYPRHDAKAAAALAYAKRVSAGRPPGSLSEAAACFARHHEQTPTEKVPHAATWLNGHRDEEWEHGPPDADRQPVPAGAFRDDRSPTEKAANPTRGWRETWEPVEQEARA